MIDPSEVEDAIAARVEALSDTAWAQGSAEAATWRRCPVPLTAVTEERLRAHLAYSVSIEGLRWRGVGDAAPGGVVVAEGVVAVVFYYRVRRPHALVDLRAAHRAARAVVGVLARSDWPAWSTTPSDLYRPGPIEGGEWLPIEVRCDLLLDYSIPNTAEAS